MFDTKKLAKEIFNTLRSYNYEVAVFDLEGNRIYEPKDGTRFFTDKKNITVSIDDENEDSNVSVIVGLSVELSEIKGLLDSLRSLCAKYGLLFDVTKYKREIEPRDFATGNIYESRKLDGSTKTSYMKLNGARMIVRHAQAIDEAKHGSRGRNISKIIVENRDGERVLIPTTHLSAGRALTRHVSKGGHWTDDSGGIIMELADDHEKLRSCLKYCRTNRRRLSHDVRPLIENLRSRLMEIRKLFEDVYSNYDKNSQQLSENRRMLLEEEMLEDRISELQEKLELEDESVIDRPTCETVARCADKNLFEGRQKAVEMRPLPKLGCNVEKPAWDDFCAGKIALTSVPKFPKMGGTANPLAVKLVFIARVCANDSIANLLSRVSEDLQDGKEDALRKQVAGVAIKICEVPASEREDGRGYSIVPIGKKKDDATEELNETSFFRHADNLILTESVREFGNWFDSLSVEYIFENDDEEIDIETDPVEDFDVDDFLVQNGSDFGYPTEDVLQAEEIVKSVADYIENLNGRFLDNDAESRQLENDVIEKVEEEGHTVEGKEALEAEDESEDDFLVDIGYEPVGSVLGEEDLMDDMLVNPDTKRSVNSDDDEEEELLLSGEDEELSPEDVVLPRNPEKALKKALAGPSASSTAELDRLLTLAGQKRAQTPNPSQP